MKESRGGKQLAMKKGKRKSKRNNVPTITQARRRIRGKKTDLLYDGNWYLKGPSLDRREAQRRIRKKDRGQIMIGMKRRYSYIKRINM